MDSIRLKITTSLSISLPQDGNTNATAHRLSQKDYREDTSAQTQIPRAGEQPPKTLSLVERLV